LGMTKTELRRYCRESGHCTRLSKNRIMLHQDDIEKIIIWVRERKVQDRASKWAEVSGVGRDPFA